MKHLYLFPLFLVALTLPFGAQAQSEERQYLSEVLASTTRKNAAFYRTVVSEQDGLVLARTFSMEGTLKAEGTFTDKSLQVEHGAFTFYHANGKVESKGQYVMGHKSGVWLRFDQWGRPLAEKVYDPEPLVNIVYTRAETMPAYPGGDKELVKVLRERTLQNGEKVPRNVSATVLVEKSGELSEVKVIDGPDAAFDERLAEAIRSTAPWKPGEEKGQPVRVRVKLPVQF
ncbi:MAG: energy transducer TonB [Flavobacteriales bacterium]